MVLPIRWNVTSSCPDCGAGIDFLVRTARVLSGSCGDCGRKFTIVQDSPALPDPPGAAVPLGSVVTFDVGGESPPENRPPPSDSSPKCGDCGASLTLLGSSEGNIEATCPGCSSTFTYLLSEAPSAGTTERRPFRGRAPREDASGFSAPRARPCRECGGPLRFSTGAEGTVTGECSACGNRFTLPPRRDGGDDRRRRGPRANSNRGFSSRYPRPGGSARGEGGRGPTRFRSGPGGFRRQGRREENGDEDRGERRRARPRRD